MRCGLLLGRCSTLTETCMFPQAGIWLAVYHLSLNLLISYPACYSVISKEAVPHLEQESTADQLWWNSMSVSDILDVIFEEKREQWYHPETSSCTHFNICGVHSQLFIYHREVRESDVPSQILFSIHLYMSSIQIVEQVKFSFHTVKLKTICKWLWFFYVKKARRIAN